MGKLDYFVSTSKEDNVTISDTTTFSFSGKRSDGTTSSSITLEPSYSNEGSCSKTEGTNSVTITPTGTFYSSTRIITITLTSKTGSDRSVTLNVYAGKNGKEYVISITTTTATFTNCGTISMSYSMTEDGTKMSVSNHLAIKGYVYDSNGAQVGSGTASAGNSSIDISISGITSSGTYTVKLQLDSDSSVFAEKSVTINMPTWTASELTEVS